MKKLLISLLLAPALAFGAATYDPKTQILSVDRIQFAGDKNELRNVVVKFKDVNSLEVIKSETQQTFFDKPFYSSPIASFNGLSKNSLLALDNGLIFKVTDDINIVYTVTNFITIYKRNDNSFFASFDNAYFNIEPFVYGFKQSVTVSSVSATGNVFFDTAGNYWQFVDSPRTVIAGQTVVVYNENVAIINGRTVNLKKF